MARHRVEIVAAAIKVGRLQADEVGAVLAPVGLHQLDAGDLGHRVPFVGRLEGAGQDRVFADRLRREFRIEAARSEEDQLLHPVEARRFHDVRLDHQIVVEKVAGLRAVGLDAADLRRGEEDGLRAIGGKPILHLPLPAKIDRTAISRDQVAALTRQPTHQRRADHAMVAGHENAFASQTVERSRHSPARKSERRGDDAIAFGRTGDVIACSATSVFASSRSHQGSNDSRPGRPLSTDRPSAIASQVRNVNEDEPVGVVDDAHCRRVFSDVRNLVPRWSLEGPPDDFAGFRLGKVLIDKGEPLRGQTAPQIAV